MTAACSCSASAVFAAARRSARSRAPLLRCRGRVSSWSWSHSTRTHVRIKAWIPSTFPLWTRDSVGVSTGSTAKKGGGFETALARLLNHRGAQRAHPDPPYLSPSLRLSTTHMPPGLDKLDHQYRAEVSRRRWRASSTTEERDAGSPPVPRRTSPVAALFRPPRAAGSRQARPPRNRGGPAYLSSSLRLSTTRVPPGLDKLDHQNGRGGFETALARLLNHRKPPYLPVAAPLQHPPRLSRDALVSTSSTMSSVSLPVNVLCGDGW